MNDKVFRYLANSITAAMMAAPPGLGSVTPIFMLRSSYAAKNGPSAENPS